VPDEFRDHPALTYERARWRQRKGRYDDTAELLDTREARRPHPEKWWPLRHWVARIALEKGDISLAYRMAAHHGLTEGIGFAQGEWLAGWISLRLMNEPRTALKHFTRLYEGTSTPVSRSRGAYWSGRAAEAIGMTERGRRWYETAATKLTTFYGQLASARLGDELFLALPRTPEPTDIERATFNSREVVQAVRRLAAMGHNDRIGRFIRAMAERVDDRTEGRMVADLARDAGRPDLTVHVARDLRRRGLILPNHLYPEHEMAMGSSPEIAVDQSLLLAIARQESSFRIAAVSPAGARGLMQLMPATAKHMAEKLEIGFDVDRLLTDADYNLLLGSAYIERLIARYDGSLLLAIAAYNAGPTRVNRWLDDYGDPRTGEIGPIDWIESMPISETRNYVQRVFESYMIYRHRVAPTRVALALDGDHLLAPQNDMADEPGPASCCL
jgi:soluble lytic murein transglycosylase